MKRSDPRRRPPPLPRNTPSTGLERATSFFHFQQGGLALGGHQWFNAWQSVFDFTNSVGQIIRFF